MTYKNFLGFASIVAFVFALGFVFMPGQLMSLYNVDLNAGGIMVGQLFGAALFGFGMLNWGSRGVTEETTKRTILNANLASDTIGFIFMLSGQLGGVPGINILGWSSVLVYLVLAAGFAYLRFFSK